MTLTLPQAAAYLHVHPETLRERVKAGIVPGAKPGKCWVFRQEDLDAYLVSLQTKKPGGVCRSIESGASGTSISPSEEARGFADQLAQTIASWRRSTTTRRARNAGGK
jgi:excisionase family DNA binding protein